MPVDQTGTSYIFERIMYRIETPNLLLRPFDELDFDAVYDHVSDPMAFAFDSLAARKIFALIDPENWASITLIERLGFLLEGHQSSDILIRGEWRDTLVYTVLESER